MYKPPKRPKGLTIVELLVGLSIGIIVLTGLLSFFFRTSKMISREQTAAKDLSQLQFVINRIVQDIKEANTQAPGTGTTVTQSDWNTLPHLPYGRTFTDIITEPDSSTARIQPTYPLAYNFPRSQAGKTGTAFGWYPKEDPSDPTYDPQKPESNSLAFYKINSVGKVVRVLYYTKLDENDYNSAKSLTLIRKEQIGVIASDTNFFTADPPTDLPPAHLAENKGVILSGVKAIKFTYPNLSKRLEQGSQDFDAELKDSLETIGNSATLNQSERVYQQNIIMNPFRNTIGIEIITAGEQIGNTRATALDLSTEVNIRN